MKKSLIVSLLAVSFMAFAQEAPKVDEATFNLLWQQYEEQAKIAGVTLTDEQKKEAQKQLTRDMQRAEVLKNEAIKAGLDKDTKTQLLLKSFETQFYAQQYIEHLSKNVKVEENDLRKIYERLGREVKIQMAAFRTEAEAKAAQEKLRKGLSFSALVASLPQQTESPKEFISPQMLPPAFAAEVDAMDKGKISSKPLQFEGMFYLLKVADTRMAANTPPFDTVKSKLILQRKDEMVKEKVQKILESYNLLD